jgi:hypothetical protein
MQDDMSLTHAIMIMDLCGETTSKPNVSPQILIIFIMIFWCIYYHYIIILMPVITPNNLWGNFFKFGLWVHVAHHK